MPPLEAKHHTSNTETLLTDQGGSSKAPPKAPHWRKQAPCRQRLLQQTTFKQAELFNAQLMGEKTSKKTNKIQLHQPSSAKLPPPKKKEKKNKQQSSHQTSNLSLVKLKLGSQVEQERRIKQAAPCLPTAILLQLHCSACTLRVFAVLSPTSSFEVKPNKFLK